MWRELAGFWWVFLLRGLAAIAFGVLAFVYPGMTAALLIMFIGAFLLIDGVFGVFAALGTRKSDDHWWLLLLSGIAGIGFGLICLTHPGVTGLVVVMYLAAWALVVGVTQVAGAIKLRKEIKGEFWYIIGGLVSVIFAFAIIAQPGIGAMAIVWLIAAWSLVLGVVLVLASFRIRALGKQSAG